MTWLLGILFSIPCLAAPISLKTAYDSALTKNESVGISQAEKQEAAEARRGAFGSVLPTLSLIGNYSRQDTGTVSTTLKSDQSSARLTLTQPLFHGLSDIYAYRAYLAKERAATAKEFYAKLSLFTQVATDYYGALSAQQDHEHLKVLLDLTEKRVGELKAKAKIGRTKKGDLLSAQAQAANLRSQLETAVATRDNAFESLLVTTGLDRSSTLEPDDNPQLGHVTSLELLLQMVEKRPDIEAAKEASLAREHLVTASKGAHWPSIDLAGNYYFHRTGSLSDSKWDIGVTATLPLFQGFSTDAAIEESIASHKQAELALAKARREAAAEIRTQFKSFTSAVSQVKMLDEAVKIAEANYQEQQRDYRYGLVGNIEVLQAMNLQQELKRNLDRAHYQSKLSYLKLLAAAGQLPELR